MNSDRKAPFLLLAHEFPGMLGNMSGGLGGLRWLENLRCSRYLLGVKCRQCLGNTGRDLADFVGSRTFVVPCARLVSSTGGVLVTLAETVENGVSP